MWLRGVIRDSLASLLFYPFSLFSTFPFSHLLPSSSILLPPFCSLSCISSLPTDSTTAPMAPLQYLPLCYLLKSWTTEHRSADAFRCPGKGCIEQREQDLRGRRTGICKKLRAGKAWGAHTHIRKGESSPPTGAERILYSISAWNCQS